MSQLEYIETSFNESREEIEKLIEKLTKNCSLTQDLIYKTCIIVKRNYPEFKDFTKVAQYIDALERYNITGEGAGNLISSSLTEKAKAC